MCRPPITAAGARHLGLRSVTPLGFDSLRASVYGRRDFPGATGRLNPLSERFSMGRSELGTKRVCGECGARFYDLGRDPIVCPKCGTAYDVAALATTRPRPEPKKAKPAPVAEETAEDEDVDDEDLVALEDVDAEEEDTGRAVRVADDDEDEDLPAVDEADDADDADAEEFLEDEDGDDDVSDLIEGDIDDEEE